MERFLESHKSNPANEKLVVSVTDQPGSGGACHRYVIRGFDASTNKSLADGGDGRTPADSKNQAVILFQNGPIPEVGVNGITQEALLAIVFDRLQSFNNGPYPSKENAEALHHVGLALDHLKARTMGRIARGVEGTHNP